MTLIIDRYGTADLVEHGKPCLPILYGTEAGPQHHIPTRQGSSDVV
ncbi:MAG: hypothetical protein PUF62_01435 [Bacteroidales bacterium]|nr:hypothetical protein [Bacteroidales bacterium]